VTAAFPSPLTHWAMSTLFGMPWARSREKTIVAFIWQVPETTAKVLRAKSQSRPLL